MNGAIFPSGVKPNLSLRRPATSLGIAPRIITPPFGEKKSCLLIGGLTSSGGTGDAVEMDSGRKDNGPLPAEESLSRFSSKVFQASQSCLQPAKKRLKFRKLLTRTPTTTKPKPWPEPSFPTVVKLCNYCSQQGNFRCRRCKTTCYCSLACQTEDWKAHRHVCKPSTLESPVSNKTQEPVASPSVCGLQSPEVTLLKAATLGQVKRIYLHDLPKNTVPKGTLLQASVVELRDPGKLFIHVQSSETMEHLHRVAVALQNTYAGSLATEYLPDHRELCAVQYSQDQNWYRGAVQSVDASSKTASILYIDFGNQEVVTLDRIKPLSVCVDAAPPSAVECRIAGVVPMTGSWSEDSCIASRQLLAGKSLPVTAVHVPDDGDPWAVDITLPAIGKNLSAFLVERGYAAMEYGSVPGDQDIDSILSAALENFRRSSGGRQDIVEIPPPEPLTQGLGDSFSAMVTHVQSPSELICQKVENARLIQEMQLQLREHCAQTAASEDFRPAPCTVCCSQFTEDHQWYRATVLGYSSETRVCVGYVDFGNSEEVDLTRLRPITKELAALPMQAIPCVLAGVKPALERWGEEAVQLLKQSVCNKFVRVEIVGQRQGSALVVLTDEYSDPQTSVNELLVSSGHALLTDTTPTQPPSRTLLADPTPPQAPSHALLPDPTPPRAPSHALLADPTPPRAPSHALLADPTPPQAPSHALLADPTPPRAPSHALLANTTPPRAPSHALLANTTPPRTPSHSHFADTSPPQAPSHALLPDPTPPQAPSHTLLPDPTPPQAPSHALLPDPMPPQAPSHALLANTTPPRAPSHTHLADTTPPRAPSHALLADTTPPRAPSHTHLSDTTPPRAPRRTLLADPTPPRAPSHALLSDTTPPRAPSHTLLADTTPPRAPRRSLLPDPTPPRAPSHTLLTDTPAPQQAPDSSLAGDSAPPPEEKANKIEESSAPPKSSLEWACAELPCDGQTVELVISMIENPGEFYCHHYSANDMQALKELSGQVLEHCKSQRGPFAPAVGEPCCAVFPGDGSWYRGMVLNLTAGKKASVYFVDYGNTCEVQLPQMRAISPRLLKLPFQAIRCWLAGVEPAQGSWGADAVRQFQVLSVGRQLQARVCSITERGFGVEMVSEGRSVAAQLLAEGLAQASGREEPAAPPQVSPGNTGGAFPVDWKTVELPRNKPFQPRVAAIVSPSLFYIMRENNKDLEKVPALMKDLAAHCSTLTKTPPSSLRPGMACCAQLPGDKSWYRAVVLKAAGSEAEIMCADYGNVEKVPVANIVPIAEQHLLLPFQIVRCALSGKELFPAEWSGSVLEMFSSQLRSAAHVTAERFDGTFNLLVLALTDVVTAQRASKGSPATPQSSPKQTVPSIAAQGASKNSVTLQKSPLKETGCAISAQRASKASSALLKSPLKETAPTATAKLNSTPKDPAPEVAVTMKTVLKEAKAGPLSVETKRKEPPPQNTGRAASAAPLPNSDGKCCCNHLVQKIDQLEELITLLMDRLGISLPKN